MPKCRPTQLAAIKAIKPGIDKVVAAGVAVSGEVKSAAIEMITLAGKKKFLEAVKVLEHARRASETRSHRVGPPRVGSPSQSREAAAAGAAPGRHANFQNLGGGIYRPLEK